VILPTHEEGFGHVILEAMLLKRPVLGTPVGGIKDSIIDDYNGLLFPINDDVKLAKQVLRINSDVELSHRLIQNGYKTVTEKFTPQAHTKQCMEALEKVFQNKTPS